MKLTILTNKQQSLFRQIVIVLTPLVLGTIEIWHPVGIPEKSAFESILPQADWWFTLHILQLPLFGLMALAVLFMVRNINSQAATISRIGIAFFVVFYTALDSIMGISGGILLRSAKDLPPNVQEFVSQQFNLLIFDPIIGGSTLSLLGILGAGGWLVGVSASAFALKQVGVDYLSFIFLILAAVLFGLSHTPPTGPLGLMFFFLAVIRINPRLWEKRETNNYLEKDNLSEDKLSTRKKVNIS